MFDETSSRQGRQARAAQSGKHAAFRYSFTEISTTGRTATLRAKHARYADGRLTSENFEGELDRGVYERAVRDAQQGLLDQWRLFLRSFSLLP